MRTTSKYIQLTDYALLEYEYNSDVISTDNLDFIKIKNGYTGSISYLNYNQNNFNAAKDLTGNAIDYTVQQVSESEWIHFDLDRPLRYFEAQYPGIKFENIWAANKQNIKVVYDKVKIHIISGYNFENTAGFLLRGAYVDRSTESQIFVMNHAFLKEDSHIKYNPRPMMLGDRTYDKYIEVKIPSLKNITDVNKQIGDIFSPTDDKFLTTFPEYSKSNIGIVFYEVRDYNVNSKGQTIIKTALPVVNDSSGVVRVELSQYDNLSDISAIIQESRAGDYFELFPTYNGEFIEDFIYDRAQRNENYTVIHDIEVYEQVSTFGDYDEIKTQNITYFQESGFDKVYKFRPVIENPNAVAFTIDYTVRLFNKKDSSQIIRRASLTYPNANKYGRWLEKLDIQDGFQPLKIVNKVINKDNILGSKDIIYQGLSDNSKEMAKDSLENNIKYLPIFSNDIFISSKTLFTNTSETNNDISIEINKNNEVTQVKKGVFTLEDLTKNNIVYGQGDLVIYLSKFDNFIKFKVFKKSDDGKLESYDDLRTTDNTNFYIVFEAENDEKVRILESSSFSNIDINREEGELLFRIDSDKMDRILKTNSNNFYITVENNISSKVYGTEAWNTKRDYEVVVYSGKFDNITNYKDSENIDYNKRIQVLTSLYNEIEDKRLELSNETERIGNLIEDLKKVKNIDLDTKEKESLDKFINTLEDLLKKYNSV